MPRRQLPKVTPHGPTDNPDWSVAGEFGHCRPAFVPSGTRPRRPYAAPRPYYFRSRARSCPSNFRWFRTRAGVMRSRGAAGTKSNASTPSPRSTDSSTGE